MWLRIAGHEYFALIATVAGQHEYGFGPGGIGCFDVDLLVADHVRFSQVDIQIFLRLQQHTGIRLPAFTARIGGVWTEVDGIQPGAVAREFGLQNIVNLMDHRFLEIASPDSGLVGDQDRLHPALVDSADCRARIGIGLVQAGIIHVPDFFGYRSIAVHEDGLVHYANSSLAARKTYSTATRVMQR